VIGGEEPQLVALERSSPRSTRRGRR
jgi:hypothetical protein